LLTTKEEQFRVPGLEVEAVSAVGAGDSFVGAMVLGLQQGKKLKDAFLYGIAAGTAALTTEATILCHRDETDLFYRQLQKEYRNI
jgi:6-phosphofructokinase 2